MSVKGACLCGSVEYEIEGEASMAGYCHCTRCQRASGGAATAAAVVSPDALKITAGQDHLREYAEEGFSTRYFCGNCGSGLYGKAGDMAFVNLGSMKPGSGVKPQMHIMVDYKADWDQIADGLPQFGEYPPMG